MRANRRLRAHHCARLSRVVSVSCFLLNTLVNTHVRGPGPLVAVLCTGALLKRGCACVSLSCRWPVSYTTDAEQAAGQASFGQGPVKAAFESLRKVLREPLDEMLTQLDANSEEWRRVEKEATP